MRRSFAFALSTVSFTALALAAASPAAAQGAAGETPDPACANLPEGQARDNCISGEVEIESGQDASDDNAIVVTGSRIRSPNIASPVPVTSVSAEDLTSQGDVNIGDALNDLPAIRSTFSQANSTRFIGTAGVNLLDLRGLGVSRTLVLVNGRRHVTYSPGDFLVDVNTIPTDLIERVDVITGGSSAVYGSDAVAGVVNFVLKRDYEGVKVRGQAGISSRGDRGIQSVSMVAGKNFFDDRANVAVNLEYVNADPLYFTQRDSLTGAFSGRCQFQLAEPTIGEPPEGDGVPDNQFFCGVRNATISDGGTLLAAGVGVFGPTSPNFVVSCTNPALSATLAARCLNPGTPQGQPRIFRFDSNGNLVQDIPSLDFRPFGSGNIISSPTSTVPGSTLRNTGQLAPGLDRYTGNILMNFEVSPAFKPFIEAKFARVDALQEGQPSFFQGSFPGFFGGGRGLRCDNPFLTPANIAQLQATGRCAAGSAQTFDTRPTIVVGGVTVTNPNFGADTTQVLPVSRFNVDFGGRGQVIRRDTYRIVGGVTGEFNGDWSYEAVLNYGRLKSSLQARNDLQLFDLDGNPAAFLLATDPIRNASGQIVCRINGDANPANDDPRCVPINVFGGGQPSREALDFVNTTSSIKDRATQLNAVAFVSGDSSQVFELPGGPVRFVIGGEYRKETARQTADPLSASGGTFFNAFSDFDPPALKVWEGFGEIQVPLLRDLPFVRELTVSAAGRYSDYNTAADKTFAWNLNGTYSPIRDLRFRANLSKSVRVPTLGDLFQPATQNFAFVSDPCDILFIGTGSSNRAANCAALGVPAGFVNTVARTQTIEIQSGGNPNLLEETGKSLTIGGVFTPSFVPGLSFTVDYYRIKVSDLIATLGAQTILNQCVDLPDLSNQFCQLINPRQADNPATPENEGSLLASPALLSSGINFARQEANGIDVEVAYRRRFSNGHRLDMRAIATRVIKRNNFVSPTDPDFADRQLSELGDPQWAANANITYGIGHFDLRYSLNFIGKQTIGAYENYFSVQGRPPQNADSTREVFYPRVTYHALRANFRLPAQGKEKFNFYIGADNIFDKKPPLGLLGVAGGDPFDSVGRYVYAGTSVVF